MDKARLCSSKREDLSREHFMELIGERVEDCAAWEKKLRSQGKLKDAEKIRKTKEQMLKRLNVIKPRANK